MHCRLETLVAESPLLVSAYQGGDEPIGGEAAVFLGLGIATTKVVATAVPFDILMLILLAEKTRRHLGLARNILVVADSTARHNSFASDADIDAYTRLIMELLGRAVVRLGLRREFELTTMSAYHGIASFQAIISDVHALLAARGEWNNHVRGYVAEEIAIMEYVRRYRGARLKLSWTVGSGRGGFDERFFDTIYRETCSGNFSFLYTVPGRTFDPTYPRVCPYVATSEQPRLLIAEGESVARKLVLYARDRSRTFVHTLQHLQAIVMLYEELFGGLAYPDLASKIQYLIDCIFLGKPDLSCRD
jgi:hypothetical protein